MAWIPPFPLQLTTEQENQIENWIPKTESDIRIDDSRYHESKITTVLRVASYLSRTEAWAIAMYLGPTEYYNRINKALCRRLNDSFMAFKFSLIAQAATIALIKMPPVTIAYLQTLPQPNNSKTSGLLRRYKNLSPQRMEPYQINEIITEPTFVSTTYWHLPFGVVQRYAENANTVYEINITPSIRGSVGRYVDPLKRRNQEGEILFPPGVQFQVKSRVISNYPLTVDGVERNVTIIKMEEV